MRMNKSKNSINVICSLVYNYEMQIIELRNINKKIEI